MLQLAVIFLLSPLLSITLLQSLLVFHDFDNLEEYLSLSLGCLVISHSWFEMMMHLGQENHRKDVTSAHHFPEFMRWILVHFVRGHLSGTFTIKIHTIFLLVVYQYLRGDTLRLCKSCFSSCFSSNCHTLILASISCV